MSIDPVTTDANTGGSFNRYVYANNGPYKYVDSDGREAVTIEACRGLCGGITLGLNRTNGEMAITLNLGAGLGGGTSVDYRPGENGRMSVARGSTPTKETNGEGGITVAGYGKVSGVVGPLGGGAKVGGGKDLVTGERVGGLSEEAALQKPGFEATIQGGLEVSVYVNVPKVVARLSKEITDAIGKLEPKLK